MPVYNQFEINEIYSAFENIRIDMDKLHHDWLSIKLNDDGQNYAYHGFLRRCDTLQHCINRIFRHCPPESEKVSGDDRNDATVFLQTFIFNVFGAIDNLGHVLNYELNLGLKNSQVGLTSKYEKFRKRLSVTSQQKLTEFDESGWFDYLINFRHALAHRIPLYIPPYIVSPSDVELYNSLDVEYAKEFGEGNFSRADDLMTEMKKLGVFQPLITHSFKEDHKQMFFHSQIIADWRTILEISSLTIKELKNGEK